jgi:acetyl/propionyl-CoA carboxylase alpha subunit
MVAGLDLVQWQIRIAAGEALPFNQDQLVPHGHAIECRLYAEDPAHSFLPASGRLLRFVEPQGPGLRVDSGFSSGDSIPVYYDPLIAKIIAHAQDRPTVIRKMQEALRQTVLLGLPNNGQFLQDVLAHPEFQAGEAHTTWVEERFAAWDTPQCPLPPEVLIAAALTEYQSLPAGFAPAGPISLDSVLHGRVDPFSPWGAGNSFRMSA